MARRRGTRRVGRLSPLSPTIRPLALAVARDRDSVLVYEGHDPVKHETFYRPLGGGIEFGELGAETVVRELREELGVNATVTRFLGVLENVFVYGGEPGHEIALMYEVGLDEPVADGTRLHDDDARAFWVPLGRFRDGEAPLYPDGLLELVDGRGSSANAR